MFLLLALNMCQPCNDIRIARVEVEEEEEETVCARCLTFASPSYWCGFTIMFSRMKLL